MYRTRFLREKQTIQRINQQKKNQPEVNVYCKEILLSESENRTLRPSAAIVLYRSSLIVETHTTTFSLIQFLEIGLLYHVSLCDTVQGTQSP